MSKSPQDLLDSAWALLDHGDAEGAAELAGRVLAGEPDDQPDDEVRGEAHLVNAHALVLGDDRDGARGELDAAIPLLPDDAEVLTDAANVALALGAADVAASLADRALDADNTIADAAYARGLAAEALGDRAVALEMFLRTAALDAEEPDPPWAMSVDEFAEIAEITLQELPAEIIRHLENVPIIVDAAPPPELIEDGIDPRLLGLFSGVPLTEKSSLEEVPTLDAIHLFQRNLERHCADRAELESEIRITVIHETAHFFGLEDDDLDELGLG